MHVLNSDQIFRLAILLNEISPTHRCVSARAPSRDVCSAALKVVRSQNVSAAPGPCPGRRGRNGQQLRVLERTPILLNAILPTHTCVPQRRQQSEMCAMLPLRVCVHRRMSRQRRGLALGKANSDLPMLNNQHLASWCNG